MAPDMSGECVFLSSVSLKQRFEMVGYSSVTAQGFIRQAKDSTPSRCDGRHTPKEKPQSVLASFFYVCLFSTLSLPHANWASQEGGMFVSPEVLTLVCGFSFFLLSQAFLYLCLLATAILDPFSYSNYLTEILTW